MNWLTRWLCSGLPITLLLFLYVTMRTVSGYPLLSGAGTETVLAESMTAFGFPLSWHAASGATSNAYKVAIVPLMVDLLVYVLAVIVLQWLVAVLLIRVRHTVSRVWTAVCVLLWFAASVSLGATLMILAPNLRVEVMAIDAYFSSERAIHQRSLAFGFLPHRQ
jgi:hypothetical protein